MGREGPGTPFFSLPSASAYTSSHVGWAPGWQCSHVQDTQPVLRELMLQGHDALLSGKATGQLVPGPQGHNLRSLSSTRPGVSAWPAHGITQGPGMPRGPADFPSAVGHRSQRLVLKTQRLQDKAKYHLLVQAICKLNDRHAEQILLSHQGF